MFDITYGGALLAGLVSFLSPCVLPMVPFYLSYMAGLSMSQLQQDGAIAPGARGRLITSSIFFALGVTTVFVILGMSATALGQAVRVYMDQLAWVAAAILFVFGLHFLGVIRVPFLYREARIESKAEPTTAVGAYLMGLAFGFGWTPCVGPALAAILMIAGGMGSIWQGGLLLSIYGLGMTAPFILAAFFAKPFLRWLQRHRSKLRHMEKIMGGMLILFAILIATNTVNYIAQAMLDWMPWFQTIG